MDNKTKLNLLKVLKKPDIYTSVVYLELCQRESGKTKDFYLKQLWKVYDHYYSIYDKLEREQFNQGDNILEKRHIQIPLKDNVNKELDNLCINVFQLYKLRDVLKILDENWGIQVKIYPEASVAALIIYYLKGAKVFNINGTRKDILNCLNELKLYSGTNVGNVYNKFRLILNENPKSPSENSFNVNLAIEWIKKNSPRSNYDLKKLYNKAIFLAKNDLTYLNKDNEQQ